MKKNWIAAIIVAIVVILPYVFITGRHLPNPPRPRITSAEFPFRIEIEHNGERLVFEDTLICEFAGIGTWGVIPGERLRVRRWTSRFESGRPYITTWPSIPMLSTDYVIIWFHTGEPTFYMDLPWRGLSRPSIRVTDLEKEARGERLSTSFFNPLSYGEQEKLAETLAGFGIELISIELTPPIENTYWVTWPLTLSLTVIGVTLLSLSIYTGLFLPRPPKPKTTCAKFPFRIELEHNGERLISEDTFICEFRGFKAWGNIGNRQKVRYWTSRFESGRECNSTSPSITMLETEHLVIKFHTGEPAFYMDLPLSQLEHGISRTLTPPSIHVVDLKKRARGDFSASLDYALSPECQEGLAKALANFRIKLISIELTPPIENTFR